ncbi:MAG: hypothetical protein JSR77_01930 [Planctomycetes bacterium]|nr:hypothetical protein [Planctomycetota bacterium]
MEEALNIRHIDTAAAVRLVQVGSLLAIETSTFRTDACVHRITTLNAPSTSAAMEREIVRSGGECADCRQGSHWLIDADSISTLRLELASSIEGDGSFRSSAESSMNIPSMPLTLAANMSGWGKLDVWALMLLCVVVVAAFEIPRLRRIGRIVPALRKVELATLPTAILAATPLLGEVIGLWPTISIVLAFTGGSLIATVTMRRRIFAQARATSKLVCDSCLYPQHPDVATVGGRCSECGRSWGAGELPRRWEEAAAFYNITLR